MSKKSTAKPEVETTKHVSEITWESRCGREYYALHEQVATIEEPTHGTMQLRRRIADSGLFMTFDDRPEIYVLSARAVVDSLMDLLDAEKKRKEENSDGDDDGKTAVGGAGA